MGGPYGVRMWFLLQLVVFFAAFAFFTETGIGVGLGMAPVIVSAALAWLATTFISWIIDLLRRRKNALLVRRKQRTYDGGLPRI